MPIYHQLGDVPHKRHTVFRKADGCAVRRGADRQQGLHGPLVAALSPAPADAGARGEAAARIEWERDPERQFRHRHFRTHQLASGGSLTLDRDAAAVQQRRRDARSRSPIARTTSSTATRRATRSSSSARAPACSRRRSARSPFKSGDYLVIPRGILHRYRLSAAPSKFLIIESTGYVRTPKRYRNDHGQLTEHAPYSERDIRRPADAADHRREGRVPAGREEGEPAVRDRRRVIIRSISSGGTATTIRGRSASTTSSRASAASICRRRCTRRSKATASSCARSARGRSISIRTRCRCRTTTRT